MAEISDLHRGLIQAVQQIQLERESPLQQPENVGSDGQVGIAFGSIDESEICRRIGVLVGMGVEDLRSALRFAKIGESSDMRVILDVTETARAIEAALASQRGAERRDAEKREIEKQRQEAMEKEA